ncbi:MAG: signal peptidase I, partial [Acidobacteria bacterium]|nr:signal peptidase I [Acidobacteriota bacterium]
MIPAKGFWRENLETVLICVLFVLFARTFVFQQSKIPTGSMEDTLLVGDYILVNRFQYAPTLFDWERKLLPIRDIQRGDVVVFKFPRQVEIDYIKRVIGLPGDVVEVRGQMVLVNGEPLSESYTVFKSGMPGHYGPVRVPSGSYFMMGDNRYRSSDSRVWGFVPEANLQGRAIIIWWSYEEDRDDYKR